METDLCETCDEESADICSWCWQCPSCCDCFDDGQALERR